MEYIYNEYKRRFISKYNTEKFSKLYSKVEDSNVLVKLTGLTVQKNLPPTATDFLIAANSILYVITKFDNYVPIIAALILLKLWNEKVNKYHNFISEQHITVIAERIVARWL